MWRAKRRPRRMRFRTAFGAPVLCAERVPVLVLKVNVLKVYVLFTSNITFTSTPGKTFFSKLFPPFKISGTEFETRMCLKSTAVSHTNVASPWYSSVHGRTSTAVRGVENSTRFENYVTPVLQYLFLYQYLTSTHTFIYCYT